VFDPRTARVETLDARHDRLSFNCGVEALDRYFHVQAGQDSRRDVVAPFVLVDADGTIVGFYTLAASSVPIGDLPSDSVRKLPRYPVVPATLLGRLAIDLRYRGLGAGRHLLMDALRRSTRSEIASFAVVVDAKDEEARDFYRRDGFMPFQRDPMRLFLPMATIKKVFGIES
jgi:GNAT superfamily N-acetyltransferase